jgi:hypothetical protein
MDDESTLEIDKFGTKIWKNKNGEFHRLDGPAIEYSSGTKEWWQNGKVHRLDGHAIESADGRKWWCQNDLYHRVDGPAVIARGGAKAWYLNGYMFKNKQDFFESLSEEDKKTALFSIDFLSN